MAAGGADERHRQGKDFRWGEGGRQTGSHLRAGGGDGGGVVDGEVFVAEGRVAQ